MAKTWASPIYPLKTTTGKDIKVDVTTSVSASLPPHGVLAKEFIPFLQQRGVERILDFGVGSLRHTIPLLNAGFNVCAVEFEECFGRPFCSAYLQIAQQHANFSAMVWPGDFIQTNRRFDAVLLCYVLQVMPIPKERALVLKHITKKMRNDSYLLYMSRYNQTTPDDVNHRVTDGYYRWPDRAVHSFYREFTVEETQDMMHKHGLQRIKSLGKGGKEQIFLYAKGGGTWV
jgi:hypothetical protein